MALADEACVQSNSDVPPLEQTRIDALLKQLSQGWTVNAKGHLFRKYKFDNFVNAIAFANKVGDVAEAEGHHPDLHVAWGSCGVEIWTHSINGLSESDFFFAAKADRAFG